MTQETLWYTIHNIDEVDSPALVIYVDRAKENIRLLKSMISDTSRLRPHVKTHKMLEITQLMIKEGISKFKFATIAEGEMLGMAKANEALMAYQPVGPKVQRLIKLIKAFPETRYTCLVDNLFSAREISAAFEKEKMKIEVFIDLNLGMNRTGINLDQALGLFLDCKNLGGIVPIGLHAYDGHIRDQEISERKKKCNDAFQPVLDLSEEIKKRTGVKPLIVAGGSPTFPIHAQRPEVETSPGTFIFWDFGYGNILPEQPFQFAALVISRIISIIDRQTLCLDLGHKSIAAENPFPRVKFLNAPEILATGQSEEHLVVKVEDSTKYKIGDVFYGVPLHVCPTCALYDKAFVVKKGKVSGSFKVISRDRYIKI